MSETPIGFFSKLKRLKVKNLFSPYLFILVKEALSRIMDHAIDQGFINGFNVRGRGGCVMFSYILIVNDSFFFFL